MIGVVTRRKRTQQCTEPEGAVAPCWAGIELAARVASVVIRASAGIDAERSRLYLDLILISLSEHTQEAIRDTMIHSDSNTRATSPAAASPRAG